MPAFFASPRRNWEADFDDVVGALGHGTSYSSLPAKSSIWLMLSRAITALWATSPITFIADGQLSTRRASRGFDSRTLWLRCAECIRVVSYTSIRGRTAPEG